MRAFVFFIATAWIVLAIHAYNWIGQGLLFTVPLPHCGDLARMAAIFSIGECRYETRIDGSKGFVPLAQAAEAGDTQFSTVFGGDSFARGRAGGPDNYFQELYAQRTGERVSYVLDWAADQRASYEPMVGAGVLNALGAKRFILLMSERSAVRSFGDDRPPYSVPPEAELMERLVRDDQAGYLDPRHFISAGIIAEAEHPTSRTRFAAATTYLYFSVFWQKWEEIASLVYRLPWRPRGWGAVVGAPDLITRMNPTMDNYAAAVIQKNAVGFDVRTSLNLTLRNYCNSISIAVVGFYACHGDLLYQAKLTEAGRAMFGRKVLIDFLPNQRATLDLRAERADRTINNINNFACLVEEQGIEFVLIVIPTRLHVYQDFIVPENQVEHGFFEKLPTSLQCGTVIDTYRIGREAANAGEASLYFYDDTHWAPPFHELVMDEMERMLEPLGSTTIAGSSSGSDSE